MEINKNQLCKICTDSPIEIRVQLELIYCKFSEPGLCTNGMTYSFPEVTLSALNAPEGDVDIETIGENSGPMKKLDFDSGEYASSLCPHFLEFSPEAGTLMMYFISTSLLVVVRNS
jgi:hypothetical protein